MLSVSFLHSSLFIRVCYIRLLTFSCRLYVYYLLRISIKMQINEFEEIGVCLPHLFYSHHVLIQLVNFRSTKRSQFASQHKGAARTRRLDNFGQFQPEVVLISFVGRTRNLIMRSRGNLTYLCLTTHLSLFHVHS